MNRLVPPSLVTVDALVRLEHGTGLIRSAHSCTSQLMLVCLAVGRGNRQHWALV